MRFQRWVFEVVAALEKMGGDRVEVKFSHFMADAFECWQLGWEPEMYAYELSIFDDDL